LPPDREERFRALYADAYADLLRFAQRRMHPSHAEDIVAEAFLVAWRRADELPGETDDARAWLFGIARNCLLNGVRGQGRQNALTVRIAETAPAASADGPEDAAVQRAELAVAWSRLTAGEQEVLSLAVFEGLTSAQAARVMGISATSYRLRLMRVRRALRRLMDSAPDPAPRVPTAAPTNSQRLEA
jgi:RNA polymerase sigma-70 factor (ECF subfamily)